MIINENFAYWIGFVQADGHLKEYWIGNRVGYRICIECISFELLRKFQKISRLKLKRNAKIFQRKTRKAFTYSIGVKRLLPLFKKLKIKFGDPPEPPPQIADNLKLFGAYLAGIIDGDGDVRVKRPKYPQCVVRIGTGSPPIVLSSSIKKFLKCKTSITFRTRVSVLNSKRIYGEWYELEFYVSKKNLQVLSRYVVPWITLSHKRKRLEKYIKTRLNRYRRIQKV